MCTGERRLHWLFSSLDPGNRPMRYRCVRPVKTDFRSFYSRISQLIRNNYRKFIRRRERYNGNSPLYMKFIVVPAFHYTTGNSLWSWWFIFPLRLESQIQNILFYWTVLSTLKLLISYPIERILRAIEFPLSFFKTTAKKSFHCSKSTPFLNHQPYNWCFDWFIVYVLIALSFRLFNFVYSLEFNSNTTVNTYSTVVEHVFIES